MAIKEITSRHTHRSIKSRPFFVWGSLFPNDSRLYQVDDKNSPGHGAKKTKVNTMPLSLDPDPGVRCLLQVTTAWELLMSYTFDADQMRLKYLDPSLLSPLLTSPSLGESSLLWGWSYWVEQSQFTQFCFLLSISPVLEHIPKHSGLQKLEVKCWAEIPLSPLWAPMPISWGRQDPREGCGKIKGWTITNTGTRSVVNRLVSWDIPTWKQKKMLVRDGKGRWVFQVPVLQSSAWGHMSLVCMGWCIWTRPSVEATHKSPLLVISLCTTAFISSPCFMKDPLIRDTLSSFWRVQD